MAKVAVDGVNDPTWPVSELSNQARSVAGSYAMPDVWVEAPQVLESGTATRWTPLQLPDAEPQLPGVAAAGSSVAIVFDHPSVHHGSPFAPTTMRCGVPLGGRTIGYSEIASF